MQWATFNETEPIWIEAESKRVGTCRIPQPLFQQMDRSPVLEVNRSRSERLAALVEVYGTADRQALITATERIRKRLGGLRTQQAVELLRQDQLAAACDIILDYYDKTYTYDLQRRDAAIYPIDLTGYSPEDSATVLLEKANLFYG
ncbi:hypothetical protein [Egbenema bharatensis]|uniref:hypothetical protein n=1 Tax=Egbenema bharatensis TaxID=3463334 RepID=UPI003A8A9E10